MRIGFVLPYNNDCEPVERYALQMAHQFESFASVNLIGVGGDFTDSYSQPLACKINKNNSAHYENAMHFINNECDICLIHHSFNVFGLQDGLMILPFVAGLKIPVVTLFHQLSHNPCERQQSIISAIGHYSSISIVMSAQSIDVLEHIYKVPREKIKIMEYGIVDVEIEDRDLLRKQLGYWGKQVLLSFGELQPSMGLHHVIEALSSLRVKYPGVVFKHIGVTHPHELAQNGESYRTELNLLVRRLKLQDHVILENRIVSDQEIMLHLAASDLFVESTTNDDCLHSVPLMKALVAGSAIVSSSFWHAQELLSDKRGSICDFDQVDVLSGRLSNLLNDSRQLNIYRQSARDLGQHYIWNKVLTRYQKLFADVMDCQTVINERNIEFQLLTSLENPHISRLITTHGVVSYSCYGVPDYSNYSLANNALALIALSKRLSHLSDEAGEENLYHVMAALNHFQNQRSLHGFTVQPITSDDLALSVAALGAFARTSGNSLHRDWARGIVVKALPSLNPSSSILSLSFILMGLVDLSIVFPSEEDVFKQIKELHLQLSQLFTENCTSEWHWFEEIFTTDTSVNALALLKSSIYLNDAATVKVAIDSAAFLVRKSFEEGFFMTLTGRSKVKTKIRRTDLEQPATEVMWMGQLCQELMLLDHQPYWEEKALQCYLWFLGENSLRKSLYHPQTGAVANAIKGNQVSVFDGAAGTFAFSIAQITGYESFCLSYRIE